MPNTIKEDQLKGISSALYKHAPELIPAMENIMRNGTAFPPDMRPGSSAYAAFSGSVPLVDGERILKVLESIEQKYGYNAIFEGRQINFLVMCWKEFSKPKQIPSDSNQDTT